jgi:hypothetical protein
MDSKATQSNAAPIVTNLVESAFLFCMAIA